MVLGDLQFLLPVLIAEEKKKSTLARKFGSDYRAVLVVNKRNVTRDLNHYGKS